VREYPSWRKLFELSQREDALEVLAGLSIDGKTKRSLGESLAKKVLQLVE
jgi:hypothetical protein